MSPLANSCYAILWQSQVVYHDGSATDTVIEVFLRHPGRQNTRNLLTVTHNHRWAVYVNPVGVDAAVAPYNARCVASGYMWNPSFVQLTAPVVADQRNVTFRPRFKGIEAYSLFSNIPGRCIPTGVSTPRTLPLHDWWSFWTTGSYRCGCRQNRILGQKPPTTWVDGMICF